MNDKKLNNFAHKILREIRRILMFPYILIEKRIIAQAKEDVIEREWAGNLNRDKTIYIIRKLPLEGGFLWCFHHVILHLMEAERRGLTPVVDMENYLTCFSEYEPINGSRNAWEYFFEQPSDISLSEAYRSQKIILSNMWYMHRLMKGANTAVCLNDEKRIKNMHQIIQKYVKFKPEVEEYIEQGWEKVRKNTDILGIFTRGTDYTRLKPLNHPIQPTPDFMLQKAKEIMQKYGIKYCFLSTDEKAILNKFKEEFGENLLFMDRLYYDEMGDDTNTMFYRHSRENPKYWGGLEYLRDVVILSRCDYLLCGIASGSVAAIEMNGWRYNEKFVIDLGKYEKDN